MTWPNHLSVGSIVVYSKVYQKFDYGWITQEKMEKKTICKFVAMHSLQQQQQPQLQPDHFSFRVLSSPSSKDISVAEDVAVVVVVAEQLHSHTLYDALSIICARPYEFDSHHLNKYESLL